MISFRTSLGSLYVMAAGCTQRTKSLHPLHAVRDAGLMRSSDRTVYISPADAQRAGMHAELIAPKRILLVNDRLFLVSWNQGQRKWGVSQSEKNGLSFQESPQVGLAPLELWKKDDGEGWGSWHAGNAIVEFVPSKEESRFAAAKSILLSRHKLPEDSHRELVELGDEFIRIYALLPRWAKDFCRIYRETAARHGKDPGRIAVFIGGGRLKGSPLKDDSDIDIFFSVEKQKGSLETLDREKLLEHFEDCRNEAMQDLLAAVAGWCRENKVKNLFHVIDFGSPIPETYPAKLLLMVEEKGA